MHTDSCEGLAVGLCVFLFYFNLLNAMYWLTKGNRLIRQDHNILLMIRIRQFSPYFKKNNISLICDRLHRDR